MGDTERLREAVIAALPSRRLDGDEADAVIHAMLVALNEPSRAMLSRGGYHCITGFGAVSDGDMAQAKAVWKAMLKVVSNDLSDNARA